MEEANASHPLIPVALAALALVATALAPAATAAEPDTVVDGLVSPLSVAVADDGTVYASQNFASLITKATPGMDPEVVFADEGQRGIGGLSCSSNALTFTATSQSGPANARGDRQGHLDGRRTDEPGRDRDLADRHDVHLAALPERRDAAADRGDAPVFAEVPFPGDVDYSAGNVYVTETDFTNDGSTPPAGAVLKFATEG
ncbi:MAG: repeat protein [Nocardioides sp.]|nr:repeat protein [Nocardioides sp.]